MFTRLFYKSLASHFYGGITDYTYKNPVGGAGKITSQTDLRNFFSNIPSALTNFGRMEKSSIYGNCVVFGDGDTPVTPDDYNISGNPFTQYAASYAHSYSEDCTQMTWVYTITNSGATAFTIREVGVFAYNYSSQTAYTGLMHREVLDSPVTIEPGGVGQVTLTFKVNIPE